MAKRTIIKQLPDGSTEVKTQGCLGSAVAIFFGFALLIYALVSPAQDYPWWGATLTYLGMAAITVFVIWGYARHQRKVKAQTPSVAPKPVIPSVPPSSPAPVARGTVAPSLSVELMRLTALHRNGALSDAEFQTAKNRLLRSTEPTPWGDERGPQSGL
jgi:hypothetical protein